VKFEEKQCALHLHCNEYSVCFAYMIELLIIDLNKSMLCSIIF